MADWRSVVRRNTCSLPLYSSHVRNFSCSAWNSRTTSPCRQQGAAQEGPGPPGQLPASHSGLLAGYPCAPSRAGSRPQIQSPPQLGRHALTQRPPSPRCSRLPGSPPPRQYLWKGPLAPQANPKSPLREGRRGGPPGGIAPRPFRPALGASCPPLRSLLN